MLPWCARACLGLLLVLAPPAAAFERIVAVGGDVAEIVAALGAVDRLIARDRTSTYPPAVEALPDVGYLRRLAAEPILALGPDLVLASAASGPETALDQLRRTGVAVVEVPAEPGMAGVAAKLQVIGRTLGLEAEAHALEARLGAELERLRTALAAVGERPRVLFVLAVGRGAPMAGGAGSAAEAIIELAGGENAASGFDGFKPLAAEVALAAQPEVILVPYLTLDTLGGVEALLRRPELAATPAGRAGRVIAMDGMLLLGFGPRTGEAAWRLALALHPELGDETAR